MSARQQAGNSELKAEAESALDDLRAAREALQVANAEIDRLRRSNVELNERAQRQNDQIAVMGERIGTLTNEVIAYQVETRHLTRKISVRKPLGSA